MDVNITSKNENKLFERKEVSALVNFTGPTPKRGDLKAAVANSVAANPETCVLRDVQTEFGIKRVKVLLHVYEKKENVPKYEPRYILVREGLVPKKEKKKKEKKAPAAKGKK